MITKKQKQKDYKGYEELIKDYKKLLFHSWISRFVDMKKNTLRLFIFLILYFVLGVMIGWNKDLPFTIFIGLVLFTMLLLMVVTTYVSCNKEIKEMQERRKKI